MLKNSKTYVALMIIMCVGHNLYAQDPLNSFGKYTNDPNGKSYISALNSKRITKNRIHTCYYYKVIYNEGKIQDSSLYYTVHYFKSGYDSISYYKIDNPLITKINPVKYLNIDSIITVNDSLNKLRKGKKIRVREGSCINKYKYNDSCSVVKYISKCGFFNRTVYKITYDSDNNIKKAIRLDGFLFFIFLNWQESFEFDENGNLIKQLTIDKKGVVKGGQKFYYEYWE